MIYDKNMLSYIAEKACTVSERFSPLFSPYVDEKNEKSINNKLETWCNTITGGDTKLFEKRLSFGQIKPEHFPRLLGTIKLSNSEEPPSWVNTLEELLDSYGPTAVVCSGDIPIAFEDILLPFVCTARHKLDSVCSSQYRLVSGEVLDTFCRSLLEQLSHICSKVLEIEFSAFRGGRQSAFSRLLGRISADSSSRDIYNEFVQCIFDYGMCAILYEYPVLCRLIATTVDFWLEGTGEFLVHLEEDLNNISDIYCNKRNPGMVTKVWTNISDRHAGGRSAIIVSFTGDLKLVYKPRDFGLEEAYYAILSWMNEKGSPYDFKTMKIINKGSHGWTEFAEHLPCNDEKELQSFYKRAGALLALTYCLEGNDFHFENIIACGEYPVLVDIETLLHPRIDEFYDVIGYSEAKILAERELSASVLHTWLLPWLYYVQDGHAHDISGLGANCDTVNSPRILQWINVNTDDMHQEYIAAVSAIMHNNPYIRDLKHSIFNYTNCIIDGFCQFYSFMLENRDELLCTPSLLDSFKSKESRFLFRATKSYAQLLSTLLHPKYLHDGISRFIALDTMSSYMFSYAENHPFWPLLQQELSAMENMDIPYFHVYCDSSHIALTDDKLIEDCFPHSGLYAVRARIDSLCEADMELQVKLINASFLSKLANERSYELSTYTAYTTDISNSESLSLKQAILFIESIAEEYERNAIRGSDGSAVWLGSGFDANGQYFRVKSSDCSLIDGCGGIALFLAAIEKTLHIDRYHSLMLAALKPLECFGHSLNRKNLEDAASVGSAIYCLVYIGRLLNRKDLIELGYDASEAITAELMRKTSRTGLLSGLSGTLLSLLALYRAIGNPQVLEKAVSCGCELISRLESPDIAKNIDTIYGFSGVAYALAELYRESGDKSFINASTDFMSRENIYPEENQANDHYLYKYMIMMRLSSPESAQVFRNNTELMESDQLIWGNFGRIELLLEASNVFARQDLFEAAQRHAKESLQRAAVRGHFSLLPAIDKSIFIPGLFMGSAGIGFELLRLFYPLSLPSVILMD